MQAQARRALAQAGLPDDPAMQREVARVLLRLQPVFADASRMDMPGMDMSGLDMSGLERAGVHAPGMGVPGKDMPGVGETAPQPCGGRAGPGRAHG